MRRYVRLSSVPERAHPLVRRLFEEMATQRICIRDVADRSGVNRNTIQDWRTRTMPRIADLDACFNVLGMQLTARKHPDHNL